jgi:predicted dehydrogenase
MFNFNNRARPESYAMMEYINQGVVGTINSCQAKWIRRTGIPGFGGWFTTKALSGGGPLIDLLHMVDLGLYFMGYPEPAHVLARTFRITLRTSLQGPVGHPRRGQGRDRRRGRRARLRHLQDRPVDVLQPSPGPR